MAWGGGYLSIIEDLYHVISEPTDLKFMGNTGIGTCWHKLPCINL